MSQGPLPYADVDSAKAGLKGRCPRCGEGRLFAGMLKLDESCEVCRLDLEPYEQADGPAFFVMSIVGFLIVGLALYTEVAHEPPLLVHLILWPVLAAALTVPLLRLCKGLMVGLQYRNKAEEGRLVNRDAE